MSENIVNVMMKSLVNNFVICSIFMKFNNYKINRNNIVKIIITTIITSGTYVLIKMYIDDNLITLQIIMYLEQTILLKIFFNVIEKSISMSVLLSNAITYISLGLAMILELIIKVIFNIENSTINLGIILMIQIIIVYEFMKIKKLKKDISYINGKAKNDYVDISLINISVVTMFAFGIFGSYSRNLERNIFSIFIILAIIMLIMIQKTLTLYYKQKLLAQTIQDYQNTIKAKDQEIQKLSDEKYNISKINHEFYNRQKALEKKISDFVNENNMKTEASNELSIIDSIKNLSGEYSNKMKSIKKLETLPRTNIEEIDDMFTYMQSECVKNNIDFKLKIEGDIYHLTNTIIDKSSLATLIGDHLRDAIIALNFSKNSNRSIFTILGTTDKCYEFCVYDSGIEFEINTLLELGTKPITTHTESGGSGIGFMTTFETLKKTGASLIIDEIGKESVSNYTKAVKIRFDKMNQYIINSYRQNEFSQKSNRIIINKILEENMIDLHMHTNYSDGTDTCEELLKNVEKKKLKVISITDHNTAMAYENLEKIDIKKYYTGTIIPGIELNTKVLEIPIEILGYGIDYKKMNELVRTVYIPANERNKIEVKRLYEKCIKAGIKIEENCYEKFNSSMFASKFIHSEIIKYSENKEIISEDAWNDTKVFYRKYMSNPEGPLYVEMDDFVPDFNTAANLIRQAGGLIFIPHIFEYRENSEKILKFILENYKFDGIECYYTTFSKEQTQEVLSICEKYNLFKSGGSDYHGKNKPGVEVGTGLGNLKVEYEISLPWILNVRKFKEDNKNVK